jgi:hypothetical protein
VCSPAGAALPVQPCRCSGAAATCTTQDLQAWRVAGLVQQPAAHLAQLLLAPGQGAPSWQWAPPCGRITQTRCELLLETHARTHATQGPDLTCTCQCAAHVCCLHPPQCCSAHGGEVGGHVVQTVPQLHQLSQLVKGHRGPQVVKHQQVDGVDVTCSGGLSFRCSQVLQVHLIQVPHAGAEVGDLSPQVSAQQLPGRQGTGGQAVARHGSSQTREQSRQ